MIVAAFLPYLYFIGIYRGYTWKVLTFYLLYREADALYDFGMYSRFLFYGPRQMREILGLND